MLTGHDKGFVDLSHVISASIRAYACRVEMICGNQTLQPYATVLNADHEYHREQHCYTAPFVHCDLDDRNVTTPLWNLHVHSKVTSDYKSILCPCPSII